MAESKSERADALAKQLKQSLAQRRPRPWLPVLAVLAVCSLILAGLVWWLYPRAQPASLEIIAFDGVFTPDETPIARAQLFAPPNEQGTRSLSGHKIVFSSLPIVRPGGEKPRDKTETSDPQGQAAVDWPEPNAELIEFTARYVGTEARPKNVNDGGRLFVWPKNAPLLIVDADETLIADKLDEQAAGTLGKAAADGWRIVYLTPAAVQAQDSAHRPRLGSPPGEIARWPGARPTIVSRGGIGRRGPASASAIPAKIHRPASRRGEIARNCRPVQGARRAADPARRRGELGGGGGAAEMTLTPNRAAPVSLAGPLVLTGLPPPDSRCGRPLPSSRASRCSSSRPPKADSRSAIACPGRQRSTPGTALKVAACSVTTRARNSRASANRGKRSRNSATTRRCTSSCPRPRNCRAALTTTCTYHSPAAVSPRLNTHWPTLSSSTMCGRSVALGRTSNGRW